jgi:hypothetical protein
LKSYTGNYRLISGVDFLTKSGFWLVINYGVPSPCLYGASAVVDKDHWGAIRWRTDARNSPNWFFKRRPNDAQGFRVVFYLGKLWFVQSIFQSPTVSWETQNVSSVIAYRFSARIYGRLFCLTGVLGIVFETKLSPMPFRVPDFPWSILWKYYLTPML